MVGLVGLEPTTPALSRRCSDQLSYRPFAFIVKRGGSASRQPSAQMTPKARGRWWSAGSRSHTVVQLQPIRVGARESSAIFFQKGGDPAAPSDTATLLRLCPPRSPHLRRLPPLRVGPSTSGADNSGGMTGGVYKPRERIHRSLADLRLLAIPTSRSRVADCDPDYDRFSEISSPSRVGSPLYRPLYDVCSPTHKGHDDLTSSPPSSGLSPAVSLECPCVATNDKGCARCGT